MRSATIPISARCCLQAHRAASSEHMFYALRMPDEFPPVRCPRCEQFNGITYTVPLRLVKPGTTAWQHSVWRLLPF
jgi:hypothetical protein